MLIDITHSEINSGLVCPYCNKATKYVNDSRVYGRSYGSYVYVCFPCKAWVGVHKNTRVSLGRVSKEKLRELKMKAHNRFDLIWKEMMLFRISKQVARCTAYEYMAEKMGIDVKECHVGYFDDKQCIKFIELTKEYLRFKFGRNWLLVLKNKGLKITNHL
jgi:hypothetical protein